MKMIDPKMSQHRCESNFTPKSHCMSALHKPPTIDFLPRLDTYKDNFNFLHDVFIRCIQMNNKK